MDFFWNSNTKFTEKSQSSISVHPVFGCSHLLKNISTPRLELTNWQTVLYHPGSRLVSVVHPFMFFFQLFKILSLYKLLVEFSLTFIFHHMREIFQFMVFTFPENALNLCIFTHVSVPHSKLQVELFENLFPPRGKGWRKLCNLLF